MSEQKRPGRYPAEMGERAVRMLVEHQRSTPCSGRRRVDLFSVGHQPRDTRELGPQGPVDSGERPGVTSDEKARLRELERENKELRRTNKILKAASAFFGAQLDRQPKK